MNDATLVAETLAGSRDAYAQLVTRYQGMVQGQAWHRLQNWADAADVAQRSFVRAYLLLDDLRTPEKFGGWLRRITLNECAMWHRNQKPHLPIDEAPREALATQPDEEERVDQQSLHDAISRLPEPNRLAVTLFYLNGMSCDEVADFLGVSTNTVKVRLHRSRKQLKRELMSMVENSLQELQPAADVAELYRTEMPVRIVETTERRLPATPGQLVVVCSDDARIRVTATNGNDIRVRARKILFGNTEEEARERAKELTIDMTRRHNLWDAAPHGGEWLAGPMGSDQTLATGFPTADLWPGLINNLAQRDEETGTSLLELLRGETVAITAQGNHLETITAPVAFKDKEELFRVNFSNEDIAIGPAASAILDIEIPGTVPLLVYSGFQMDLDVVGLRQDLYVLSAFGHFSANDIGANVSGINVVPTHVGNVAGNVRITDSMDHRGVEWAPMDGSPIRRWGSIPTAKIHDVAGSCRIRCPMQALDLRRITGSIDVRNDHGRTSLRHDGAWTEGKTVQLASNSGNISLRLGQEADETTRTGVWTQCGAIDRNGWARAKGCNTPEMIYLGTSPQEGEHDIRIRTQTGKVKVVAAS